MCYKVQGKYLFKQKTTSYKDLLSKIKSIQFMAIFIFNTYSRVNSKKSLLYSNIFHSDIIKKKLNRKVC